MICCNHHESKFMYKLIFGCEVLKSASEASSTQVGTTTVMTIITGIGQRFK